MEAIGEQLFNLRLLIQRIKRAQTQYQFLDDALNRTNNLSAAEQALIDSFFKILNIQYRSRINLDEDDKARELAQSRDDSARLNPQQVDELARVIIMPFLLCLGLGLTSLLTGVYGFAGSVLFLPALGAIFFGLFVLYRTIRDTKHDFHFRPWAAFAFIGLSALLFAGLGIGLFFMSHAIAHAHHAGGTFLFGVLTTLIVGVSFMFTEIIKCMINGIDSHLARKNDSYVDIHSGFEIDETKLKATCEAKSWDIDVTREALRTLAAQYDRNEKQIFPMTQTTYSRKTLNLFSSILNGKYLNKDNEPIITTVVDGVVQHFDLRGGEDYRHQSALI